MEVPEKQCGTPGINGSRVRGLVGEPLRHFVGRPRQMPVNPHYCAALNFVGDTHFVRLRHLELNAPFWAERRESVFKRQDIRQTPVAVAVLFTVRQFVGPMIRRHTQNG